MTLRLTQAWREDGALAFLVVRLSREGIQTNRVGIYSWATWVRCQRRQKVQRSGGGAYRYHPPVSVRLWYADPTTIARQGKPQSWFLDYPRWMPDYGVTNLFIQASSR